MFTHIVFIYICSPTILTNIGFSTFGSISENQSQTPPLDPSHHECVPIDRQFHIDIQDLKDKLYLEEGYHTHEPGDTLRDQQNNNDTGHIRNHAIPLEYTRRFSFYQQSPSIDTGAFTAKMVRLEKDQLQYNFMVDSMRPQRAANTANALA